MKHTTFLTALLSLGLLCGVNSSHAAQPQEKPAVRLMSVSRMPYPA